MSIATQTLRSFLLVLLLSDMALAQVGPRSTSASAWPIYLDDFTLSHGQTVEYRTIYTTPGVDPVMHLLRRNGSSWVQVASNDNYSGLEARIFWTNTTGSTQRYLIVLRSKDAGLGVCDVLRNGSIRTAGAPVMGQLVPATALGFAVSDELLTNHRPGGSATHAVFTLTTTSGLTIGQAGISNGIGGAAYIGSLTGSEKSFLVGTPWVKTDITYDTPFYGLLNLFGNDIGTDTGSGGDSDRVGNALEDHLGTCKKAPCSFGYFARDSDRDGLNDGEELWGIAGITPDGSDDVPLARWGADPRRKDVFIEIDYGYDAPNSLPGQNPFASMTPTALETWVDTVRAPFLAAPASHVKNPNGVDGIQLHLDLGVDPPPLKRHDESRYGNYSSASQRCVVKDWHIDMKSSVTGQMRVVLVGAPSVPGPWVNVTGLSPFAALQALVGAGHPSTDIAYRAVTDGTVNIHIDSGERLSPGEARARVRTNVPCQDFIIQVWHDGTDPAFASKVKVARESHDALKYRNWLPYFQEFDSVRRTRFRYVAYAGGGQAWKDQINFAGSPVTFVHELGHTIGLEHWGRDDWGLHPSLPSTTTAQGGPTCLPHYRSIMTYAYVPNPMRFANDGDLTFNPARSNEEVPFGPNGLGLVFNNNDHWTFTGAPWLYDANATTIDFDRNGTHPSPFTMRTAALTVDGGACHAFGTGSNVMASLDVRGSVDLVRVGNRLHAFWISPLYGVMHQHALLGSVGNKSCAGSATPGFGTSCLTWSNLAWIVAGDFVGLSAYRVGSQIFIALTRADLGIEVHRFTASSVPLTEVLPSWDLTTSGVATHQSQFAPELTQLHTVLHSGTLALIYRSQSQNRYYQRTYNPSTQTWSSPTGVLNSSGAIIQGSNAAGALSWPGQDVTTWTNSERRTVAVFPEVGTDKCHFYVLQHALNGNWTRLIHPVLEGMTCLNQPSLAFRTRRATDGVSDPAVQEGHLMIAHAQSAPAVAFSRLLSRTQPPAAATNPSAVGCPSGTTNCFGMLRATSSWGDSWTHLAPNGNIGLYSDVTLDNVFGLGAMATRDGPRPVFYPHSDGSPDLDYRVRSDFKVMENELCRYLRFSTTPFDATSYCGLYVYP